MEKSRARPCAVLCAIFNCALPHRPDLLFVSRASHQARVRPTTENRPPRLLRITKQRMSELADDGTASLSHLSSQLLSYGYTSRPLDLVSLFLTPAPSHALQLADPGAYAEYVERIRAEGTARDQVVKCLWNMLGARMDSTEGLDALRSREMVGAYELERCRGLLVRAEKERDKARKDAELEKAKAK